MKRFRSATVIWLGVALTSGLAFGQSKPDKPAPAPFNVTPPHILTDKSVRYDYDIVYVRAPRYGEEKRPGWAEFSDPTRMELGADLMLLHPNGDEELLVSGSDGSVMDPYVSFDGESVYYAKFIDPKHSGADLFKFHVKSRRTVKLTSQTFTPNTGAAPWSSDFRTPEQGKTALRYGVYNLGPCPAPGGKIIFTSNRNAHVPPRGYPKITLQLFTMDDDGANVEQIGYINVACALHPVILTDGRLLFSTLESHGQHNSILWGIWSIRPDGTYWAPVVSAFATGGAPSGFHFQAQLSDSSIIVEEYYNLNNSGFGTYFKLPLHAPAGTPPFAPAWLGDKRNSIDGYGPRGQFRMPFAPHGMTVLTRFTHGFDGPAPSSIPGEQVKARLHGGTSYPHAMGKVTHPCGAPDNHLLTVWSAGPANHQYDYHPFMDAGIYLIKDGKPANEPGQMLLIKNDPRYNEQWPRPLVPYKRVYGIDEPKRFAHENYGALAKHLPEGTPFGLVGSSSLYKRESAPGGRVLEGSVTAAPTDPKRLPLNWQLQGADAGLYDNSEIHAIRILAQEPRTDIGGGGKGSPPLYGNHALERLRILGEIPVRKFGVTDSSTKRVGTRSTASEFLLSGPSTDAVERVPTPGSGEGSNASSVLTSDNAAKIRGATELQQASEGNSLSPRERVGVRGNNGNKLSERTDSIHGQPKDPDGNPDTSFLAKIPADQAFTFQTIDKHGMVLNMAQTWHQLRPGELRNDCGGCHAHSQKPTLFANTFAARDDYQIFDLTKRTPLITSKKNDQSGKQWDKDNETGLRFEKSIANVEYYRDIRPIFERSCVACHSHKLEKPEGGLILDDDDQGKMPAFGHDSGPDVQVPLTYFRLAAGTERFKPRELGLQHDQASRYLFKFQSRRSLLVWKIFGRRMDGSNNDDFPSLTNRFDPKSLHVGGQRVPKIDYENDQQLRYWIRDNRCDIDYEGSIMPPPDAIDGKYKSPDGRLIKVAALSDENRRTIVRWIDLGCPIDLDPNYDPKNPQSRSFGWMGDDQRPTLTVASPSSGKNLPLRRIVIGMADAYSGLDLASFKVTADFPLMGLSAGQDLASKFKETSSGIWELALASPLKNLAKGRLTVSVRDKQGNVTRIERVFSIGEQVAGR